jgi:hypothetical protein
MSVIFTKICPLVSINEALNYIMTISHEIPVGLKIIQKKKFTGNRKAYFM